MTKFIVFRSYKEDSAMRADHINRVSFRERFGGVVEKYGKYVLLFSALGSLFGQLRGVTPKLILLEPIFVGVILIILAGQHAFDSVMSLPINDLTANQRQRRYQIGVIVVKDMVIAVVCSINTILALVLMAFAFAIM